MRDHLYAVGQKVGSMMKSPDTPNEVKLKKGFTGVLYEEWRKDFEKQFPSVDLSDVTEACSKALNLRLTYAQLREFSLGSIDLVCTQVLMYF